MMAIAEALLVRRHQAGGDHRADAEEGAVRERGEHARRHQQSVVGRQRAGQVAEREDHHQREQHGLARQRAAMAIVSSGAPTTTPSA